MAGPTASVVVSRDPAAEDLDALRGLLDPPADPAAAPPISGRWITGASYDGEDLHWFDDVARCFGFLPRSRILLAAEGDRPEDHRRLGEVALDLARRFGGVINLHGALEVGSGEPVSLDQVDDLLARLEERLDWTEVSAPTDAFLRSMPGRVLTLPYETMDRRTWVEHICDAEFMAAWLRHPGFHMIK